MRFISNLKRAACASKQDKLVLATILYVYPPYIHDPQVDQFGDFYFCTFLLISGYLVKLLLEVLIVPLSRILAVIGQSCKVHIFWEGHKNMTKSPNFLWQNGLLSKFFSKIFDLSELQLTSHALNYNLPYCQGSSSQIKSITQPLLLLAGWKGSLGTCSR